MAETGVSSEEDQSGLHVRPAIESPQASVNIYPISPKKAENSNHDLYPSRDRRETRYPYTSVFFLLGNIVGQSYSGTGLQAVLELYFAPFLYVCSGVSRAKQLSTTSVNVFIAVYQLCALSAGFLADKVLGNFIVQTISILLSTCGLFLLTFSTWQLTLDQPQCCSHTNSSSLASFLDQSVGVSSALSSQSATNCSALNKVTFLEQLGFGISPAVNIALAIIGLTMFAIGYGHVNTLQSVLVADQFTEEQSKSKERSFSWFYLCCNVGSLVGESGMPIIRQTVGFVVAWMTVFGSSAVSVLLFLAGSYFYVKKKPQGLSCCSRNSRGHTTHSEHSVNVASGSNDDHEDKPLLHGKVLSQHSDKENQSSTEVENMSKSKFITQLTRLKELLPFLGVFAPLVVFWAIFYQQNSTWILQGAQMNCDLGKVQLPPDLMPSVNDFMVIVIIPTLDYLVYPHLERTMGYKVKPIHKLVAGMVAAALSFLMSGLLQVYLPESDRVPYCRGNISIMWQLPQLLLISFAEVLVSVTGLEFAYSQAPPDFRNLITSFWYIAQALGTLLNAGIVQIPGLTLLEEFFTYMALMLVVTSVFILINWRYRYRSDREVEQRTDQ